MGGVGGEWSVRGDGTESLLLAAPLLDQERRPLGPSCLIIPLPTQSLSSFCPASSPLHRASLPLNSLLSLGCSPCTTSHSFFSLFLSGCPFSSDLISSYSRKPPGNRSPAEMQAVSHLPCLPLLVSPPVQRLTAPFCPCPPPPCPPVLPTPPAWQPLSQLPTNAPWCLFLPSTPEPPNHLDSLLFPAALFIRASSIHPSACSPWLPTETLERATNRNKGKIDQPHCIEMIYLYSGLRKEMKSSVEDVPSTRTSATCHTQGPPFNKILLPLPPTLLPPPHPLSPFFSLLFPSIPHVSRTVQSRSL